MTRLESAKMQRSVRSPQTPSRKLEFERKLLTTGLPVLAVMAAGRKVDGQCDDRSTYNPQLPPTNGRYGKIGISAVAAALPYQSDAKNPAYAPVVHRDEEWRSEMVAA